MQVSRVEYLLFGLFMISILRGTFNACCGIHRQGSQVWMQIVWVSFGLNLVLGLPVLWLIVCQDCGCGVSELSRCVKPLFERRSKV